MAIQTKSTPKPDRTRTTPKSTVAAVFTSPDTVLDDYVRLAELAGMEDHLPRDLPTLLKINISWQYYYPACSTPPWQIEGAVKALQANGYNDLIAAHNGTVVVDAREGEVLNKQKVVTDKYDLPNMHLEEDPVRWIEYRPRAKMLALDEIFPDGIQIPEPFIGKNIVQLPTMKTHVFTRMTGAMKNAFGGLLNRKRHYTHSVIHETLVDLLAIQKEIHPGIFAMMERHLRRRWPRAPGHAMARQKPSPRQRRPGRHRRRRRQANGLRPHVHQVHPPRPRRRPRVR